MIMNKQLLYTLFTLFSATFFSCTSEIEGLGEGMGTVRFSVANAENDVVIETRALSSNIDEGDLILNLTRGEETLFSNRKYSDVEGHTYTYSAGTGYLLTAENCTEAEAESASNGWGKDRVYGETSFEVKANQDNPVELPCRLANSAVEVNFSGYVKNRFPDCEVRLYAADKKDREFIFNQHVYRQAYFNGKRAMQYFIKLTENGEEHDESDETPFTFALEPGHYYELYIKIENEESASPELTVSISVDGELVEEPLDDVIINPYQ